MAGSGRKSEADRIVDEIRRQGALTSEELHDAMAPVLRDLALLTSRVRRSERHLLAMCRHFAVPRRRRA